MVLKFELPNARVLNFPQNSAPSLIGPVLIIGDCVYAKLNGTSINAVLVSKKNNEARRIEYVPKKGKTLFFYTLISFESFG